MLIDSIAPEGIKSSYFSAQSLGLLGGALTPILTGIVLTELPPDSIFLILITFTILAWFSMLNGMRIHHQRLNRNITS